VDGEKHNSGVMEVIAIAALLLLIWKYTHKKRVLDIGPVKPVLIDVDREIGGDPDFDLNTYCKKVVNRPLSMTNLAMSELLPQGWCFMGDNDIIDKSKGFGDAYADTQADAYNKMKEAESAFIALRSVVQFRLINSTGAKLTTNLLNTTQDPSIINGTYDSGVLVAPLAEAASGASDVAFSANWGVVSRATGYLLDVATDSMFLSLVPGYNNLDVGNVLTYNVTGLSGATQYFYRVRAYDSLTSSVSSNTISAYTRFNDFFLPSQDELVNMHTNLYLFGMGGFIADLYHSSTENGGNGSTSIDFTTGTGAYTAKGTNRRVRACRSFITASGAYPLRSMGPAGGLIFIVVDNGNGTDTCYEAAPSDQSAAKPWSNVTSTLIGTTGAIVGTGKANTAAIIGQAGHIDSAAKLCDDLIV
jgi:hypothetical protein